MRRMVFRQGEAEVTGTQSLTDPARYVDLTYYGRASGSR
jgi:hypothetical protein